jgi:hypothetical protein
LDLVTLQQAPGARNAKRLQKDEKRTAIDNLLTKHVLLGCALRLLLLPLQLEIELLLALHCRKKSQKKVHKNHLKLQDKRLVH